MMNTNSSLSLKYQNAAPSNICPEQEHLWSAASRIASGLEHLNGRLSEVRFRLFGEESSLPKKPPEALVDITPLNSGLSSASIELNEAHKQLDSILEQL